MIQIAFDLITITLLLGVGGGAIVFHQRINRLRDALVEAGRILPQLDEAASRMQDAAGGFSGRIRAEMEDVDGRVSAAKRLATELNDNARAAKELIGKLEQQLRQAKRLEAARAQAVPRELAEPKGFAERLEKLAVADIAETPAPMAPAAAQPAPRKQAEPRREPSLPSPRQVAQQIAQAVERAPAPPQQARPAARPAVHQAAQQPVMSAFPAQASAQPQRERIGKLSADAFNTFATSGSPA